MGNPLNNNQAIGVGTYRLPTNTLHQLTNQIAQEPNRDGGEVIRETDNARVISEYFMSANSPTRGRDPNKDTRETGFLLNDNTMILRQFRPDGSSVRLTVDQENGTILSALQNTSDPKTGERTTTNASLEDVTTLLTELGAPPKLLPNETVGNPPPQSNQPPASS